jgi:hypothetical protein
MTRNRKDSTPVYENGILVGHNCTTWNFEGTRQITVFIPRRDEDVAADRAAKEARHD